LGRAWRAIIDRTEDFSPEASGNTGLQEGNLAHYCCAIAPRAFALLDDTQVQRLIDFSFDHLLLRRRHQLNGMTLHAGDSEAIPFKGKELLDLV